MAEPGPVAGRLRRPGWKDPRLVTGLLLIAVAVVGVTLLVRSADATSPHWAARDTLVPGSVLTEADAVVAHVRVGEGRYLAQEGEPPWGAVLARTVEAGELIPASALVDPADFGARPIAVTTSSALSERIERGSLVDVWHTAVNEDGTPRSDQIAAGVVVDAVETSQGAFSVGGGATVYVVVDEGEVAAFLEALATEGEVSVVGWAGP